MKRSPSVGLHSLLPVVLLSMALGSLTVSSSPLAPRLSHLVLPVPRSLPLPSPVVTVTCHLSPVTSVRPPVVVVEGDFLGAGGASVRAEAAKYAQSVRGALEAACVGFETSRDSTVEKWGLPASCQVALLPYNRAISTEELAKLRTFIGRGGKVIAFYVGPEELLLATGVRPGEVLRAERDDQFAKMVVKGSTLPLLPGEVTQRSWNVRQCEPLPGSVVVAAWADASGRGAGLPAVVLGEKGAFVSHVFVGGEEYRKGMLLRSIIGRFAPEIWGEVARRELQELNAVGRFGTLDGLADYLQRRRDAGQRVDRPLAAARQALALRKASQEALGAGEAMAAVEASTAARLAAAEAFYATSPSKPGELRGAWMIYRGRPTWDETMRRLRQANLNAAMPRFCSAGVAYFPSRYLPLGSYAKENGDQLAAAAAAASQYGVALHARMLALFIYEAPSGVREAYAKAGRLMISADGGSTDWLCPSHPENRKLVVGACLEMASRYPVAGIQLDYVRYPWKTYCFCPTCRATFQRDAGVKVARWPFDCLEGQYRGRFADWRREQITSLVREISLRLRDVRPGLQFSAAVFLNWETHRESFGQDWKAWVDEGLLDFVCPMDYTDDDETFTTWVTRQRGWVDERTPLCIGIGPRVESCNLSPEHVLRQVEISRRLGGDGFVLFDYDETLAGDHLPVLASGLSSEPARFTSGPPYLRSEASGATVTATLATTAKPQVIPIADAPRGPLSLPQVVVDSAQLHLYTADAWPVLDLGPIEPDRPITRKLQLSPGAYRLCAQGNLTRPGSTGDEAFVRWGLPFAVGEGAAGG